VPVLLEGSVEMEDGNNPTYTVLGRTERDSPEVDGYVFVKGRARLGQIVPVRIHGAGPYDLYGEELTRASEQGN
jgi:ribosomal protein S12 methylthiotransferase